MNCDKYYKVENDGTYNVHFLNSEGYNIEEIKGIFSAFGKVLAVNVAGDTYGYRFIKYRTLDEIIRCVQGLQNNSSIRLLPEKLRHNVSRKVEENDSNQWQLPKRENSFSLFNIDKQFTSNFHDTNLKATPTFNLQTYEQDNISDKAQAYLNINSENAIHYNKYRADTINSGKSNSSDSNRHSPFLGQEGCSDKNFSNTMNFERYYRETKDSCYSVHFINKKGLTLDEIKELFSSYGNVLNVYDNDNRFVFVKYKTVAETVNCLKGLQNNSTISILPQKDKMNSTTKRTDQNGSQETSTTRTRLSSFSYNKTPAEAGNRLSSFVMRTSNLSNRKDDKSPLASTEKLSISSRQEHFGSDKASNEKPALSSRQENFGSDKASDHNWTQGQSDGSSHFLAKADGDNYVDNNISNIPALISDAEIKKRDFDATSESSLLAELNNASAKTFVMPMQEVIVANIHTNYGMYYILHLFEKYNPIAATTVQTIPETDIRYCHVYFETVQDATAVEKEFDNFVLSGRSLIVLRKLQLIKEVKIK